MLKELMKRLINVQVTHKSRLLSFVIGIVLVAFLPGCEPNNQAVTAAKPIDTSLCNFKIGVCTKTVADVDIQLSLSPWQATSEKPLTLDINTSKAVSDLKVKLQGRDMFMGIIPVNLNQSTETDYNAELIYGSCSSGYMVWSAVVSYKVDGVEKFTTFDFLADNPG
ncbi:hypothetical protein TUM4438_28300 [Shewanella sairae]|uniref:Lipoprotein n=1 Tax=Shewanella sairae TaxID=190310 RepID=A0ABQ4PK05_9GAMM|nr:hypothetical protein [Shewanella sairae]MCL1129907.1 hypothetical protein [Shewanella sairae]GIU47968.1 hypothetical protein TUM4438_28300 [Shewanella sairae]